MSTNNTLSLLRDAFHTTPSRFAFAKICACFDGVEDKNALKVCLDYASNHLGAWPVHTREPDMAQVKRLRADVGLPPYWPLVRRLTLDNLALRELRALLRRNVFDKLDALGFSLYGPDAMSALSGAKRLGSLRVLQLHRAMHGVGGILVGMRQFKRLEVLDLEGSSLRPGRGTGDTPGLTLARNHHFGSVRRLNVARCGLSRDAAIALVTAPHFDKLQALSLGDAGDVQYDVNDQVLMALCGEPSRAGLKELDFSGRGMSEMGVGALAECDAMRLTHLDLSGSTVGRWAMGAICGSEVFSELQWLVIGGNDRFEERIDDEALMPLLDGAVLPALRQLHLVDTDVTHTMVKLLSERIGSISRSARSWQNLWHRKPNADEVGWLPDDQTWSWWNRHTLHR